MTFEDELDRGHKLLLVGAVAPYLVSLFQGDAVGFIIGWAASLVCAVLFLKRYAVARRKAGRSMILPAYMLFALSGWLFWTTIQDLARRYFGDAVGAFPFFVTLALVVAGAVLVFRESEAGPSALEDQSEGQ